MIDSPVSLIRIAERTKTRRKPLGFEHVCAHVSKKAGNIQGAAAAGRPVMYGLALGGHLGVRSVLEYLRDDLHIVMQLAGTPNIKSITRDRIAAPRTV